MVTIQSLLFTLVGWAFAQTSLAACPAGYVASENAQQLDIIASPAAVWNLIGDFGNLSWAGVSPTLLSPDSVDDVPGAIRSSIQIGLSINETLLSYNPYDPITMTASEVHSVQPFSTLPYLNATVSAPYGTIGVAPICNGLGTRLTFHVTYCSLSSLTSSVDALFTTAHYGQLLSAQKILSAANYTAAICPGFNLARAGTNGTIWSNGTFITTTSPGGSGVSGTGSSTTGNDSNSTGASSSASSGSGDGSDDTGANGTISGNGNGPYGTGASGSGSSVAGGSSGTTSGAADGAGLAGSSSAMTTSNSNSSGSGSVPIVTSVPISTSASPATVVPLPMGSLFVALIASIL